MSGSTEPVESAEPAGGAVRVLRRQDLKPWERVMFGLLAVLLVGFWWFSISREAVGGLPLVVPTVVVALQGLILLRPDRVELRDHELVLRSAVRTRRVPYESIVSVRGDIPSRTDWSSRLQLELRDGRTIAVPSTREPLTVVHDLIAERVT